ncbi:MAG TPA: chorismate synthase [Nitrospira sp.]|nr:chorismate synthase [Nitrospira sp.]
MAANTFGRVFTVTSFGESHGPAIGCVVDGCPPGLSLATEDIQKDLDRRKPGTSRHVTQRQETDTVEILSGVFEGKTTGTPIALLIRNQDARSRDYGNLIDTFRPGHADYTYWQKYGIRDHRGGGRASARETAVRVAAAAIARKWLHEKYGVTVRGYLSQLGPLSVPFKSWDAVGANPFFAADSGMVDKLESFMDELRKSGDSVGARITAVAEHVPVGWGAPVYAKLDADLAAAMMSINAVKAVEIGAGFASVAQRGSEHGDELTPEGFATNHAGGILGGISTGQDVVVSVGIKPTSSIRLPRRSIDKQGNPVTVETNGRHDPCVGLRATPVVEAMLALVLMDHALLQRAQNADVRTSTPKIAGAIGRSRSPVRTSTAAKVDPEPHEA